MKQSATRSSRRVFLLPSIIRICVIVAFLLIVCTDALAQEILWDSWGVPHIFAEDSSKAFYAFGWAQMFSHGDLILRLYGEARGRASEYWGEEFVSSDQYIRRMGVPGRAEEWWQEQDPEVSEYLREFAAGMNDFANTHQEALQSDVRVVLPVVPQDILAHIQRVIHLEFLGSGLQTEARSALAPGSNGWAIAPSRSESGKSMLLMNPHLPWSGFYTWYEAHIVAPGLNSYGAALVGFPVLGIAFNDSAGWTHTVNPMDGADLYKVTRKDGGYLWSRNAGEPPSPLNFQTETQILRVKQRDGTIREEPLTIRRTIQGPVIAENESSVFAARLTGLDQPHFVRQYWDMMKATNLKEFETAVSQLQIPVFNIIYADREGHIMYLFGGRTPIRQAGSSFSSTRGIVAGNGPENLWTETLPYESLPRLIDPKSGWIQNANDPPWTSTLPSALSPSDFPSYLTAHGMGLRAQYSARTLANSERLSFDRMVALKHSTHVELADRILNDLLVAASGQGGIVDRAVEVLRKWDRNTDANSEGAVLFLLWAEKMGVGPSLFKVPWNEREPVTTPHTLADPRLAVVKLKEAAVEAETRYGRLNVPWGDVFRLRVGDIDLPANGGPDELGIFRELSFQPDGNFFRQVSGDSWVAVVEFGTPVRAEVLLSYGNSTQLGSPHFGDQLKLYAQKALRPAWRTRAEIEAHLERRDSLIIRK